MPETKYDERTDYISETFKEQESKSKTVNLKFSAYKGTPQIIHHHVDPDFDRPPARKRIRAISPARPVEDDREEEGEHEMEEVPARGPAYDNEVIIPTAADREAEEKLLEILTKK